MEYFTKKKDCDTVSNEGRGHTRHGFERLEQAFLRKMPHVKENKSRQALWTQTKVTLLTPIIS